MAIGVREKIRTVGKFIIKFNSILTYFPAQNQLAKKLLSLPSGDSTELKEERR
jgi:hypothetical protein